MLSTKAIPHGLASHPYAVRSIDDLTDELQHQARQYLPPDEQVSSIFIVPRALQLFQYRQPQFHPEQALLFTGSGVLWVQESDLEGNFTKPIFIRADTLISMQVSLILLYGRLHMIGLSDGQRAEMVLEYNTVGHEHLQPSLKRFLVQAAKRIQSTDYDPTLERRAKLDVEMLHMKYRNGLFLYGLDGEEHLTGMVFQPAIRHAIFLGLQRVVAYPVLLALTNHHLIILGEEQAKNHSDYGWVITYCPLPVIHTIESIPEENYTRLIVHLRSDPVEITHEVKVDPTRAQEVLELWGKANLPRRT
jgi:hypothetical protein